MLDLLRDPVCGMEIPLHDVVASAVSEDRRFSFCCLRCYAAFLDTPHRYVGWEPRPQEVGFARLAATGATSATPRVEPCHFTS